ncbi:ribbon-helix-helix domain-containing protein [Methanothermobacter sp. DP]|uniref:ribbon-helix-helix domain-containing protein n=1 Tax=Methanothermobacter sp. DP TaxID=2998972 RepID=UPI002AA50374|nr:ribbon-helix-helix domain-containing protein [Methanothermobacter sp. DP]
MVKVRKVFSLDLSIAEEFQRHSEESGKPMSWIVEYLLREYLRSKKDSRGGNHNHPPHKTHLQTPQGMTPSEVTTNNNSGVNTHKGGELHG